MRLAIIGARGMVGQVLVQRMLAEGDFDHFETYFFSTSQKQEISPYQSMAKNSNSHLLDAFDVNELKKMDIILSCQGGDYTQSIFPQLKAAGFKGYWIDAASTLRLNEEATIILDPVNLSVIKYSLKSGIKTYVGGNCTVSLLLMALSNLFKHNHIEWISSQTYQAASGAGARHMQELLEQMQFVSNKVLSHAELSILEKENLIAPLMNQEDFPKKNFGHALSCNLLPWIDADLHTGQSKEEWKAQVEANKILQTSKVIPFDGNCVRVGSLRCHAQGLTIKLNSEIPLAEIEDMLKENHQWMKVVPNNKIETLNELTPHKISGTLDIGIGRLRKLSLGESYLNAFTLGDQLLWGAAEPLRRMLHIILDHKN